ncbi:MAG: response regulator [Acidobacteria bacterium]|nr:response regulator [Acidobacteriota bacterium]
MNEGVANRHVSVFLRLARAIAHSATVEDLYPVALDALHDALGVERSSILLFDDDGVMRFKASRGLSAAYKAAVEGHSPWKPGSTDAGPIVVEDVAADRSLVALRPVLQAEGIAALVFVPLTIRARVIGKFMLYFAQPHAVPEWELDLAQAIAAQVAFAVERTRTELKARRNEERLRFALDAASMGTWDWNLETNEVVWSDNLARIHGLPDGTFDGTFASYEREIHPHDRERVLASAQRALHEGLPHDVEYRIVAPDGTVRWCEGKGRVEYEHGRPVRMSGVCMIVTRRKEAELARLAAAEEASRLKDEFLATLSHELRTPLNAILGWVQILQSGTAGADRVRQAIEVIGRNARLQAQLIEEILDVSRIITGKLHLERTPLAPGPLIDAAVTAIAPSAQAKGITLVKAVADGLPPIEADARRLQQVLGNVLSNAVKFTPDGGEVRVSCASCADGLRIEVADTGAGIDAAFLPYVFDRFRQADSRTTRRHGGLGLGLAIARYLVEQHGGSIAAASEGPGRGTTIAVTLPGAVLTAAEPGASAPGTLDEVRFDGRHVVVVDDQADSCEMLAALIERQGARVVRCGSSAEVLAQLSASPADLLIADIAMPESDGYDLIARLRDRGDRIPAIAVTAFARSEDERRTRAAGFDAFCAKPVDASHLLSTMAQVLEMRQKGEPLATAEG